MDAFCLLTPEPDGNLGQDPDQADYMSRLADALAATGRPVRRLPVAGATDAPGLRAAVLAIAAADTTRRAAPPPRAVLPDSLVEPLALAARNDPAAQAVLAAAIVLVLRPLPPEASASPLLAGLRAARLLAAASPPLHARLRETLGRDEDRAILLLPGSSPAARQPPRRLSPCRLLCPRPLAPRELRLLHDALTPLWDLDWRLALPGAAQATAATSGGPAIDAVLATRIDEFASDTDPRQNDQAAMASHWAAADIIVLPMRAAFLAAPLMMALRRGLPVATTAPIAIMPPELGVVAALDDAAGLSRSLRRLICDERMRALAADAAWDYASRLPVWTEQAERVLAALHPT